MNTNEDIANNAISVYGAEDASLNDFPVLKAFQQYIDAEQTKARKRMLWLSVFFGALMIAVVSIFVGLLISVSHRNQALNDKLVEFAMQERDRQVEAAKEAAKESAEQSARNKAESDAAFKALADALSSIQRQISEQNAKQSDLAKRVAERPEGPSADQIALQNKLKAETEKLKRATALLQSEKAKLAAKKEALRQQEIEVQRRRLYPEYYSKEDATSPAAKPKPKETPKASPQSIDDLEPIDYFAKYEEDEEDEEEFETSDEELKEMMRELPKQPVKKATPSRSATKKVDHYGVPLKVNGESAKWLVPAK